MTQNKLSRVNPLNEPLVLGLSKIDLEILLYPFRAHEHEFLKGIVYIREPAIANRLDKVDLNWQFLRGEHEAVGDAVIAHYTLNVKGVSRANTGSGQFIRVKSDGTETSPNVLAEAIGNAYKSATTDAFKRCARLFGIGRYLLGAPKQGGDWDKYLARKLAEAKVAFDKVNVEPIPEIEVVSEE